MNGEVLHGGSITPEQAATLVNTKFPASDKIPFDLLVRALAEQVASFGAIVYHADRWAEWERPIIREAMNRAWALYREASAMRG